MLSYSQLAQVTDKVIWQEMEVKRAMKPHSIQCPLCGWMKKKKKILQKHLHRLCLFLRGQYEKWLIWVRVFISSCCQLFATHLKNRSCHGAIPSTPASSGVGRADDKVSVHWLTLRQLTAVSGFLKNCGGAREKGKKDNRKNRGIWIWTRGKKYDCAGSKHCL